MSRIRLGISCYPTFGGSGIIATEMGLALARQGHDVHFISSALPRRLDPDLPNVSFHPVSVRDYPLFPDAPYALALASQMVAVTRSAGLDLIHAHYALPHATSAWMAREVLGSEAPRLVTTLHGTDITLVGADPAYLPIVRHSIAAADAVTAPSNFLREETWRRFDLTPQTTPIALIPNFVDTEVYRPPAPGDAAVLDKLFAPGAEGPVLVHTSNFRAVKRPHWVVDVFSRLRAEGPARLLLIGDGPEHTAVEARLDSLGLREDVAFAGLRSDVASLLRVADVFLLPSLTESFGLAALEALSSGVPVVASEVGGLPDTVTHGVTGLLAPLNDLDAHVEYTRRVLRDPALRRRMGQAGRADALARFTAGPIVARYLALYDSVLAGGR